jgi:hypothetical protein
MKIQIIKKGNVSVNTRNTCPFVVDVPPEAEKKD